MKKIGTILAYAGVGCVSFYVLLYIHPRSRKEREQYRRMERRDCVRDQNQNNAVHAFALNRAADESALVRRHKRKNRTMMR